MIEKRSRSGINLLKPKARCTLSRLRCSPELPNFPRRSSQRTEIEPNHVDLCYESIDPPSKPIGKDRFSGYTSIIEFLR